MDNFCTHVYSEKEWGGGVVGPKIGVAAKGGFRGGGG